MKNTFEGSLMRFFGVIAMLIGTGCVVYVLLPLFNHFEVASVMSLLFNGGATGIGLGVVGAALYGGGRVVDELHDYFDKKKRNEKSDNS